MIIHSKSKCDLLTEAIIEGIISGRYVQGEKLPSESELEEEYKVSRVTVRESLKQLRTMGLVTIQQGDGTIVNQFTLRNYLQPLFPLLVLNDREVSDLYMARAYIEMGAATEAVTHIKPEQTKVLGQLISEMEDAFKKGNNEAYTKLDSRFHFMLCEASDNQAILSIFYMIKDVLDYYIRQTNQAERVISTSLAEHKEIFKALQAGDTAAVSASMKEHILHARDNLLSALQKVG